MQGTHVHHMNYGIFFARDGGRLQCHLPTDRGHRGDCCLDAWLCDHAYIRRMQNGAASRRKPLAARERRCGDPRGCASGFARIRAAHHRPFRVPSLLVVHDHPGDVGWLWMGRSYCGKPPWRSGWPKATGTGIIIVTVKAVHSMQVTDTAIGSESDELLEKAESPVGGSVT